MTKTKEFILICFVIALISSCKKDKEDAAPPTTGFPNYSELKTGNYWIYQEFTVDSIGTAIPTSVFDSCYVEKDTLYMGQTYFKMYTNDPVSSSSFFLLRDSLHYIVDSSGQILFSSGDTTSIFSSKYLFTTTPDSILFTTKMDNIDEITIVPAGSFKTRNFKKTYFSPTGFYHPNPKIMNTKYAENVGIVSETLKFFSGITTYSERRLVRYHLN